MLVAGLNGERIEALDAERGPEYNCPECKEIVILKKGRIVSHHFAHKPPVTCGWGRGETHAHRAAKWLFKEEFVRRGLRAEVESMVESLPNDRRADVMVWSPSGRRYALEFQHVPIGYDELELRTRSYLREGVRVMWIPFLRSHLLEEAEELGGRDEGDFKITRFPVRPMEKWVHDKFGELWMYDPNATSLWRTKLKPHYLYVDEYYEYGSEDPVGGYHKISKRWSELVLWGPYCLKDVQITQMELTETTIGNRTRGVIGKFVLGG